MEKFIDIISKPLMQAFADCGYNAELGAVSKSSRPDLCEFQCNGAMSAAKLYKKAPFIIADEVAAKLADSKVYKSVEVVKPGFINININEGFLLSYALEMRKDEKFGCIDTGAGKTIVIDYGGPNVAKPLHVGHLRPAIIGESLKRIKRACGYNVIGDVHLGDWGLQMGLVIEGLLDKYPLEDGDDCDNYIAAKGITISDLEKIYPEASARSKTDEDFSKRAHEATFALQGYDKKYYSIWKQIVGISIADLKENYKKLEVDFDIWKGESDAQPYIPDMIEKLTSSGIAYKSENALVVDVKQDDDKIEIPPCIILKSDGASLYTTTDLATLIDREKNYSPDEVIYVVDNRQDMHFKQVFRCARKGGLIPEKTKLLFLGFGTMNGPDGKPFKTRDGGVMRLENLLGQITEKVQNRMAKADDISDTQYAENVHNVALSAVKYGDLSNQISNNYVFDVDKFCEFEGNTGPYILYTIARINSICTKYKDKFGSTDTEISGIYADTDKKLYLALVSFNDVIESACENNAPHRICQYIYQLCNELNHFYHEVKILAEEDEAKRRSYIGLVTLAKNVLTFCTDLLGFDVPSKM